MIDPPPPSEAGRQPGTGRPPSPSGLPPLPRLPQGADPWLPEDRAKAKAKSTPAKAGSPSGGGGPALTAPSPGGERRPARWVLAGVILSSLVVIVVGVGLTLSSRSGSPVPPASEDEVDTAGAVEPADANASEGDGDGAAPADGYRVHVGRHFTVEVPASWQTTYEDRLVSVDPESLVTRWEVPFASILSVTTSDPMTGTVDGDCARIFGSRERATVLVSPTTTSVAGREVCEFAYVRPDDQVRVEYLFAERTREFLVTAGAGTEPEARAPARHAVETIEAT